MRRILVVDDEKSIRQTFEAFLTQEEYEVLTADSVALAIDMIERNELDLIITDIIMPKITGIELLKIIKEKNPDIPIVIMTGKPNLETAMLALKRGADDYLTKPVNRDTLIKTVKFAIERKELIEKKKQLETENTKYRDGLEELVEKRTDALQKAMLGTISTIASIMELRDPYTAGHERRVGNLAVAMAIKMSLSKKQIDCLYVAGYIHDIGKMVVPADILSKPGKLSEIEFSLIKTHSAAGYEILKKVYLPWHVAEVVNQHHERINGSGYPLGLKKDEILIEAKVLAVADVIEAMAAHRPYRAALGIDVALDEIESKSGTLYDEKVAEAALALFRDDKYKFTDEAMEIFLQI